MTTASRRSTAWRQVRAIIGTRDGQARTAHDIAAQTEDREQLPEHVQSLPTRRANALHARRRPISAGTTRSWMGGSSGTA
ncbi:hypothetical protein [Mycobacterium intracellulare]|uniref:hypothetical protein n=1 Tax=Mycobacterium intracellulare TaxID=1767 RepID=UPI0011599933|nr:hypothetical protein [Mycobacterium intracellulare]